MKSRVKKDITIRFVPNILFDEGRTLQSFSYNRDWTIRKYLKKSGFDFKDMRIVVNGNEVKDLSKHLDIGDEIVILPYVEFAPAAWATLVAAWKILSVIIAVTSVAYSIYHYITYRKPKKPTFDTSGTGMDAESPSHSWDGVRTTSDVGRPIPIIIGTYLVGGNVINEYVSTDGDKNYLNTLLGIGQGEVDSITLKRINRNPAENYPGYTLETKLGTNDQTVIKHFEDNHRLKNVSVQLTKDNPYIYTTEHDDVEAFEIHFQLPSGLYYQSENDGSINSWAVTYKIEYKLHANPDYIDLGSTTISAKSRTTLRRIFRKEELAAGQYDIRVTRTSDDSDFYHTGDLYLNRVDEINTDDQEYPNIALAGVRALAMEQLSGAFPDYEFEVKGKSSIPKVMNGEEVVSWDDYYWDPVAEKYKLFSDGTILSWDGETFISAYAASPIWGLYYIMINKRFGLGHYITAADHNLDYLIEMSQYCEEKVPDGKGGWEKRFRMDICIDSPQGALDLIVQLCSIFRGLPFYSDKGQVKIAIEKPDTPVQLFGMGNIVEGSFSETWGSIRDVPNIVQVQFDDEEKNYESQTIEVPDEEAIVAGNPINVKQIRYYGTKLSYAIRHGRNYIKVCKYATNTIKLRAGIGAIVRQAGELIDIAHDVPQWGFSGRVLIDSTTTKVKLDRQVTIEEGKSYAIRCDFADGTYKERTVTDPSGNYTEVTVDPAFDNAPAEYDVYSFGEVNKVVKPARIVSLGRKNLGEVEIEAIEYNENIFDDSEIAIPQTNYSSLSLNIPNITDLKLTERLVKLQDGTIENAIDVWFDIPPPYSDNYVKRFAKAKIFLSEDNENWGYRGETFGRSFSIVGDVVGRITYYVKVVTVTDKGEEGSLSVSPSSSIELLGKAAPPSDVTSFLVNQSRDRLVMGWAEIDDVDVWGYEIKWGTSWDSGHIMAFKQGNKHVTMDFRTGVEQSYWIKAIDTSGNYSENATEATITVDNIPFRNIVTEYSEQTAWSGNKSDTETSGDNLIISSGELSGTYETPVRDVGYVATFLIAIEVITAITQGRAFDDDGTTKFNSSVTERFTGAEAPGAATFEIKTSQDNIEWTDYAAYQVGDYICRYFQLRMTLTRENVGDDLLCSTFDYYSDLPDVDDFSDDEVTSADDGKDIIFGKTYREEPIISIDILSGEASYWKITSIDITGFTVILYDSGGQPRTGTFSWKSHGI